MLSSLLYAELELNKQTRLTERAETEALNHPETGCYDPWTELYNLNGWWQLLDAEESRCAKYALPAWVFYIDTNPVPWRAESAIPIDDRSLLIKTSQTLFKVTNPEDVIAQVDDNRFAILAVESNSEAAKTLLERLRSTFESVNIPISVGYAMRHPEHGLRNAWKDAEQALNRAVKAKSGRDSAGGR
jgi:GGDEF domain-containing protein